VRSEVKLVSFLVQAMTQNEDHEKYGRGLEKAVFLSRSIAADRKKHGPVTGRHSVGARDRNGDAHKLEQKNLLYNIIHLPIQRWGSR